jgi:hypothetical protein
MELAAVSMIKVAVAMMNWRMAMSFGFNVTPSHLYPYRADPPERL